MPEFVIDVTETWGRKATVTADSLKDAIEKVSLDDVQWDEPYYIADQAPDTWILYSVDGVYNGSDLTTEDIEG